MQSELRLIFKHAPQLGFANLERRAEPNQLLIKLDASTGVGMILDACRAGASQAAPIMFDVDFAPMGGDATPYEVLLQAAMTGNSTRFTRQCEVEETWRIIQPLLNEPPPVHVNAPRSWGPLAADTLFADRGGWRDPWVES
jgi:glucose-6-phosphate 1-dehydrogenase